MVYHGHPNLRHFMMFSEQNARQLFGTILKHCDFKHGSGFSIKAEKGQGQLK
jgi:hypothetical protein